MTTISQPPSRPYFRDITAHAHQRMLERGITCDELLDAEADCQRTRQAGGRWEIRGANGICFITDPSDTVVLTVMPRAARPKREHLPHAGVSRHRARGGRRPEDTRPATRRGAR